MPDSNSQIPQTNALPLCRRASLQVHMPTVLPVLCSLGLYQDTETNDNHAQRAGYKACDMHRQHSHYGGDKGASEGPYSLLDLPSGEPGFHNPTSEVFDRTYSRDRVSWSASRLTFHGTSSPGQKLKQVKLEAAKML